MADIDFLTHEQVCELTGASRRAAQIENLKLNKIRHTIKVNGWPCVTAAAVLGIKDSTKANVEPEPPVWVLDLSRVK
ncbi:MAG: DUF4224 domain-containing protein [Pseudomonas sp.]|uniref:DUF4224 domain-containing protein n=1 Tax=Pseudomonas sp. TaxID=306 RepID=UPI003D6E27C1